MPFQTPRPREKEKEGVLDALRHAGYAGGALNCSRPRVKLTGRLGTKLQARYQAPFLIPLAPGRICYKEAKKRMESVKIRELRSQAKIVGTAVCVGGAMVMTLYKVTLAIERRPAAWVMEWDMNLAAAVYS
ncbi:hypothetical protein KI387_036004, partial [Taxus chinensis]